MPHVLFIMEKFHTDSTIGKTNNYWNLLGSYECSGLGTYEVHYIDPTEIWSQSGVDHVLNTRRFDAAFISVFHHTPSHEVHKKFGHKMALLWWDSILSMPGVRSLAPTTRQFCFDWGKGEEEPNVFCVNVPQDERVFYRDKNIIENIDVSFVGSITDYWSDRRRIVEKIKDAGINIYAGGGRGHGLGNLSIEEYSGIFRRSKICLNLSYGHGRPQRKGRSFEIAACGKFMLTNCPEMFSGKEGTWFDENVDYVSFTEDDLIDKIKHYLSNNEERERISDNIYKKYVEN